MITLIIGCSIILGIGNHTLRKTKPRPSGFARYLRDLNARL
jgi:hypothetical protein